MTPTEINVLRAQMAATISVGNPGWTAAGVVKEVDALLAALGITHDAPAPAEPAKPVPLPIGMRHLGIVREFIQHKAINGDRVKWGSDDPLQLQNVTVLDMETLATKIALDAYQNKPAKPEPDSSVIKRYVKRPVVIEAAEFTEQNTDAIVAWVGSDSYAALSNHGRPILVITTLEGDHEASLGDFIIKGVKGEFYPCKPDIFAMTYSDGQEPTKPEPDYETLLRNLVEALETSTFRPLNMNSHVSAAWTEAVAAVRP